MTAALRAGAGGDVQYGGVPGAGAGEHRQMMGPGEDVDGVDLQQPGAGQGALEGEPAGALQRRPRDRKSTRLNSSHVAISYAVFCLKKKKKTAHTRATRARQPRSATATTAPSSR